jgi:hypothetical protein
MEERRHPVRREMYLYRARTTHLPSEVGLGVWVKDVRADDEQGLGVTRLFSGDEVELRQVGVRAACLMDH